MFKKRVKMKWMAGVLATAMTVTLIPVSGCQQAAEAKSVPKLSAKKVILTEGKREKPLSFVQLKQNQMGK